MSENSKIQWTDHTFNPWWGCTKVHDGCKNCYAETFDKRVGGSHWGPRASRRMILGEWSKPAKWNKAAERAGVRARVFCASMCDLFERFEGDVLDQTDRPVIDPETNTPWTVRKLRRRALDIVRETPWLDWLLLTKRPENVLAMVPADWRDNWPTNVMTGTSPCDQPTADKCIPELLRVPGRHFLSVEPMLGPVDLDKNGVRDGDAVVHHLPQSPWMKNLHWVIVGGESGPKARPCDVAWIRSVVEQCKAAGVPCFVKQLGSVPRVHTSYELATFPDSTKALDKGDACLLALNDRKGGDMAEWPEDLRVRETPAEKGAGNG